MKNIVNIGYICPPVVPTRISLTINGIGIELVVQGSMEKYYERIGPSQSVGNMISTHQTKGCHIHFYFYLR